MHETIASPLEAWGSFYVIVGSSAGALTGLQFVVMTLIAQTDFSRGRGESISAFGTPNVVHFCAVLLVASILSVPWSGLGYAGIAVAVCGLLGTFYSVAVIRRAHRQRDYQPVLEDWVWHTMLPLLAYAALFVAGAVLGRSAAGALLVTGAAALLLVFIGIHNAWDTVTYVTTMGGAGGQDAGGARGGAEPRSARGEDSRGGATTPRESGPGASSATGVARASDAPAARRSDTRT
jgi:hypothetical protein